MEKMDEQHCCGHDAICELVCVQLATCPGLYGSMFSFAPDQGGRTGLSLDSQLVYPQSSAICRKYWVD